MDWMTMSLAARNLAFNNVVHVGAEAPRGCTNLKLRQLTRLVTRDYDAMVGASGLKTTQYSLLSHIERLGPLRPGELAAHMRLEPSTLTRNLQPLVAAGWVELGAGTDARSRLVQLTTAGREKRAEGQRCWTAAQQQFNERVGVERVVRLHALIDECIALLETDPAAAETELHHD